MYRLSDLWHKGGRNVIHVQLHTRYPGAHTVSNDFCTSTVVVVARIEKFDFFIVFIKKILDTSNFQRG